MIKQKQLADFGHWNNFVFTHDAEKQQQLRTIQYEDLEKVDLKIRNEFTTFIKEYDLVRTEYYNPRKKLITDRDTYYSLVNGTYAFHQSKTFPLTVKQQMLRDLLDKTCIYDWLYEAFAYGEKSALFQNENVFNPYSSEDFTAVLGHVCYLFKDVLLVELRKPENKALKRWEAYEIFQQGPTIVLGKSIVCLIVSFFSFLVLAGFWYSPYFYVRYALLMVFCACLLQLIWHIYRYIKALHYTNLYVCRAYGGCFCSPILLYKKNDKTHANTFQESADHGKTLRFLP